METITQAELDTKIKQHLLWQSHTGVGEMADFDSLDLSGLKFVNCILREVVFDNCDFNGVQFNNCVFLGCFFEQCTLNSVDFESVCFVGIPGGELCIFKECSITGNANEFSCLNVSFKSSKFDGLYLNNFRVANTKFAECKFMNAVSFEGAQITSCQFDACEFDEGHAPASEIINVEFVNCDLKNVNFDHCSLNRTRFFECKLAVNFYDSTLLSGEFNNSNIEESNLSFCDLTDCKFIKTELFAATLTGAKGLMVSSVLASNNNVEADKLTEPKDKEASLAELVSELTRSSNNSSSELERKIKSATFTKRGPDNRLISN